MRKFTLLFSAAIVASAMLTMPAMAETVPIPRPYPGFQLESGELLHSGPGVSAQNGTLYVDCANTGASVNFRDRDGYWYKIPVSMNEPTQGKLYIGENSIDAICT